MAGSRELSLAPGHAIDMAHAVEDLKVMGFVRHIVDGRPVFT